MSSQNYGELFSYQNGLLIIQNNVDRFTIHIKINYAINQPLFCIRIFVKEKTWLSVKFVIFTYATRFYEEKKNKKIGISFIIGFLLNF